MEDSIEILKENRHLRDETEVSNFDSTLAELPEQSEDNVAYLTKLFDVFVDDCDQPEVMWGLLHFAEDFDDETYIPALLISIDELSAKALDWLEVILSRVLNNDDSKKHLVVALKNRSESENYVVIKLLEMLKEDDEIDLQVSATKVLLELQKDS
jgi:Immunity protein 30